MNHLPAAVLTGLALGLTPGFLAAQKKADLYELDTIRTFKVTFPVSNWWTQLLNNRATKTDLPCDLTVDGFTYKNVGLRFRGSTDFVATGNSKKKSFNITMDSFVAGQNLYGHTNLNLSNAFNDPSFLREVMTYQLMRRYMPAPGANYIKLILGTESWGLYVSVQQPNKDFLRTWYKGNDGNRYEADPTTSLGVGKSALQWLGPAIKPYTDAYELKSKTNPLPWTDLIQLCNVLNNFPNAQLPLALPKVLGVDRAMWYLGFCNVFLNLNSYLGRGSEYFLYHDEETDRFDLIAWDVNESFGGFPAGLSQSQRVNLSPYWPEQNTSGRPLVAKLLGIPKWRRRYTAHVRTLTQDAFDWAVVGPLANRYRQLIDAEVKADPKKLYSYDFFQRSLTADLTVNSTPWQVTIPGIKKLVDARKSFLQGLAELKKPVPAISNISVLPAVPRSFDIIWVRAKAGGASRVGSVSLHYRVGGASWLETGMFDDGKHQDGAANDGVYGGSIPPQSAGRRVFYYVAATDGANSAVGFEPRTAEGGALSLRVAHPTGASGVRLNEFLAINRTGIRDERFELEDWIELYNATAQTLDFGGMYLTDNLTRPTKWKIPAPNPVPAGGFMLIWADNELLDGPLHAAFKLNGDGEEIGLFDKDGRTLVDSIQFGSQLPDVSEGRLFDGKPLWAAFPKPSPKSLNAPATCGIRRYDTRTRFAHWLDFRMTGTAKIGSLVNLGMSEALPNGLVFLLLSPGAAQLPLSSSVSLLVGLPIDAHVLLADATGRVSVNFPIPDDIRLVGVRLYLQFLGLNLAPSFRASNGVEIMFCPK
ncbi:MAG: CotH kinase family protein [Planctomycetota bacterium]